MLLQPFGIYHGRQITEFPDMKTYRKLMLKTLMENNVGPKQRKQVTNYIGREIRRKTFAKRNAIYRKQEEWGYNCVQENLKKPFHGVVHGTDDYTGDNSIPEEDFSDHHPLMNASVGRPICRNVIFYVY